MRPMRSFVDYSNPNSIGSRLRLRRFRRLLQLIDTAYARRGSLNIIDLGGTPVYWSLAGHAFLRERYPNLHITLVNLTAKALAPGQEALFTSINGDACSLLQFADNSFDLVHSNSTIEHVGGWDRMKAFAREVRRLAPSYYLQTPYFWFPVEPHFLAPFFHWLPDSLRAKLMRVIQFPHFQKAPDVGAAMDVLGSCRLLDKAQVAYLFPDAKINFEWLFGLPKSLMAVRD